MVVGVLITSWFLTSDLFHVPQEVSLSRERFATLKQSYYSEPEKWSRQKAKRLSLEEEVSPEAFLSYLAEQIELEGKHFQNVAIYPIGKKRLLLSKQEKGPLLLTIIVSLEIELQTGKPHLITLKRGSRELPPELAWVYFGEELQLLQSWQAKP